MLSTSSQPSPRGVAGRLACPEHSHSRCTLAVCLTYGKQSLEQAAPPGVGTVLGLCARPGHSALPGPTKLGTPWSGRTKLWHLRSSDHYLWKTPETNPYESTCFLHFSSHLFYFIVLAVSRILSRALCSSQAAPGLGQGLLWCPDVDAHKPLCFPAAHFTHLSKGSGHLLVKLRDLKRKKINFLRRIILQTKKLGGGKKGQFLLEVKCNIPHTFYTANTKKILLNIFNFIFRLKTKPYFLHWAGELQDHQVDVILLGDKTCCMLNLALSMLRLN